MNRKIAGMLMALTVSAIVHAASEGPEVDVLGLFSDAAVLSIDGRRQLLRNGEQSEEGVTLIRADSREAVVEYQGERLTLQLSDKVSSRFERPAKTTVSIPLNDRGQYVTHGSVNGRPVRMLVDTGATIVAMNARTARELGVDFTKGEPAEATTAGGVIHSWQVTLDSVEVGEIRIGNVPAAVLEGDYPQDILLGMTFLRNVEITERAGLLMLTNKL